jgi:hypothetical protein
MDYLNPNYAEVLAKRARVLSQMREDPEMLKAMKIHYATHPWDFINDWGMLYEPRNVSKGLPPVFPFIMWPRQIDLVKWMYERWMAGERGLVEKSRDFGVTWLAVGFSCSNWLFVPGFTAGFGSRKEELVDRKGDMKAIFPKIRFFLDNIPPEFLPQDFDERHHSSRMNLINPTANAAIIGEAGDNIGRGGRASVYFMDEAAFVQDQESVDNALSQNTDCQIDISTPNGNGNAFYRKAQRFHGTPRKFVCDWRDDPRKTDEWYQKQLDEHDEVTVAQEIDRDYNASAEDVFIPAKHIAACIDAHIKLGFQAQGIRVTAFDPSDDGRDPKGVLHRHGSVVTQCKYMRKGDITQAIPWAIDEGDGARSQAFTYDGDGMGTPAMKLALTQMNAGRMKMINYRGSDGVEDPDEKYGKDSRLSAEELEDLRTNAEEFLNYRAQTATWVRDRAKNTYEAIQRANKGMLVNFDPEQMLSISSECEELIEFQAEISRPKRIMTPNGKKAVESKKQMKSRGVDSPTGFDLLVMAFSVKVVREKPKKKRNVRHHR